MQTRHPSLPGISILSFPAPSGLCRQTSHLRTCRDELPLCVQTAATLVYGAVPCQRESSLCLPWLCGIYSSVTAHPPPHLPFHDSLDLTHPSAERSAGCEQRSVQHRRRVTPATVLAALHQRTPHHCTSAAPNASYCKSLPCSHVQEVWLCSAAKAFSTGLKATFTVP